jgi:hypothetical protein
MHNVAVVEAAACAWVVGASAAVVVEFEWAVAALAAVEFEWEARVSVVVPSVFGALVYGEVRESIAGSVPGFALPVHAAAMLAVLSVLDGQAFAKADFTANAGMATDGAEGGGASQLRRPPLASVTMPGGMGMTTAASLGTATSG